MNKLESNLMEKILSSIQDWLLTNHNIEVDIDARYIDSGLIDSFDMINLIDYIEELYKIKFSSQDFQDPRFFTVRGLCELISEKISNE